MVRLRWYGHVEGKDTSDWVSLCIELHTGRGDEEYGEM